MSPLWPIQQPETAIEGAESAESPRDAAHRGARPASVPGHLGRLCRRQKRRSGGRLKRPGRLGERSGHLWRCGGRERSYVKVKFRRGLVFIRVLHEKREKVPHPGLQHVKDMFLRPGRRAWIAIGDHDTRRLKPSGYLRRFRPVRVLVL